jgi:iron complex outermembrane receptor protein
LWSNAQTADKDSLLYLDIAPVTISVARLESSGQNLPFAVSILQKNWIQLAQAQRSLGEALVAMPGVYAWNTDNYAQDLRISIRGFGARSAFGIRGIRVFTDGIPETSPDGQTDLDNVDMGTIQRIELLRGAAAGLYGNAAGGILQLTTENTDQHYAEIQTSVGSLGFYRWQFKSAFHQKKLSVFFNVSQNHLEGYRTQSSMQQTIANAKWQYRFSPDTKMTLLLNYGKSPYANDPGGLTAEQVLADRKQARAASLQYRRTGSAGPYWLGIGASHCGAPQH